MCSTSVLRARLGLKDDHSARLWGSLGPFFTGTGPLLVGHSVLGQQRPTSHGRPRFCSMISTLYEQIYDKRPILTY